MDQRQGGDGVKDSRGGTFIAVELPFGADFCAILFFKFSSSEKCRKKEFSVTYPLKVKNNEIVVRFFRCVQC
jgi:hypothetical protein